MRKPKVKKLLKEAYGRLFGNRERNEHQGLAAGIAAWRGQDWKHSDSEEVKQGWNESLAIDSIRNRL